MWKNAKAVGGKKKITDEVEWKKWGHGSLRVEVCILGEAMTSLPADVIVLPAWNHYATHTWFLHLLYTLWPPFSFNTFICIAIQVFTPEIIHKCFP